MLKTFLKLSQEQLEPGSHHIAGAQQVSHSEGCLSPWDLHFGFCLVTVFGLVLCPAFFITWTDTCTAPPQKDAKRNLNSAPERGGDLAAGPSCSRCQQQHRTLSRVGWLRQGTAGAGSPSGDQESSAFPRGSGAAAGHRTAKLDFSVCQALQRKGF